MNRVERFCNQLRKRGYSEARVAKASAKVGCLSLTEKPPEKKCAHCGTWHPVKKACMTGTM